MNVPLRHVKCDEHLAYVALHKVEEVRRLQTISHRMLGNFLSISGKVRKWKVRGYWVSGVFK